jgi:ADP-heptose:LPS heptosyltransferase
MTITNEDNMDLMDWILQHKDYGLGNFVNLTSVIFRKFLDSDCTPVNVYFESEYVKEIYSHAHYINTLDDRPDNDPFLSSSLICRENTMRDADYVLGHFYKAEANTYAPYFDIACIMNGCANPDKRHTKNPGADIYNYIIEELHKLGYITIFVGSEEDLRYSPFARNCTEVIVGNPVLCAAIIEKCDMVVSNDTGFYHLAGAYEKDGFILWKDTLRPKNESPNEYFTYSTNWKEDFDDWIDDWK